MKLSGIILAIWNFAVFVMYGSDKIRAKHNVRRISEKTLLLSAFFLGGIGAFFGMQIFRHKTKHLHFVILVPIFAILTTGIVVAVLYTNLL